MNRRTRELLAHVARANSALVRLTVECCSRQDGGDLPPDGVAEMAAVLRPVLADLDAYTAERVAALAAQVGGGEVIGAELVARAITAGPQ